MNWTMFACVLVASGCNAAAITSEIRPVAARELRCPEAEIRVRSRPRNDWERVPQHKVASGCGKTTNFVRTCNGTKNCWYSVNHMRDSALRTRVAFDLGCSAESIELTHLDPRTSGATGCGQKMTYVLTCPHDVALWSDGCAWVANVESRVQIAAPPKAATEVPAVAPPTSNPPPPEAPAQ